MKKLVPFTFEKVEVRVVEIDGEPWFVGKDVAERLGYADPTSAMKQHCKGVVKRHPLSTAGGVREVRILSEPDVLRLIIKARTSNTWNSSYLKTWRARTQPSLTK